MTGRCADELLQLNPRTGIRHMGILPGGRLGTTASAATQINMSATDIRRLIM